jgi:hypothetical protein
VVSAPNRPAARRDRTLLGEEHDLALPHGWLEGMVVARGSDRSFSIFIASSTGASPRRLSSQRGQVRPSSASADGNGGTTGPCSLLEELDALAIRAQAEQDARAERGHGNWRFVEHAYALLPHPWYPAIQVIHFEGEVVDHARRAASCPVGE